MDQDFARLRAAQQDATDPTKVKDATIQLLFDGTKAKVCLPFAQP